MISKLTEQSSRREPFRARHTKKGFQVWADGPSYFSCISGAGCKEGAQSFMTSIMFSSRVFTYVPRALSGSSAVTDHFNSSSCGGIRSLPETAQESPIMRKDDHLRCSLSKASDLLDRGQSSVFIEAGDRIVDHNNLVSKPGFLVKRGKKERQSESITIAGH